MVAGSIIVGLDIRNEQVRGDFAAVLASQPDVRLYTFEKAGTPDLIILEAAADRSQTLTLVRSLLSTSSTTEIFLTATHPDLDMVLEAMRVGVKEFIRQPLDKEELDHALQRFRERHQAREPQKAKGGKLINLMGSKGGIGTTTIAVNLAISLQEADAQRSVVVMDLNQPFGDVALFLDLAPTRTFGDVVRKTLESLDETFLRSVLSRHASGVYVLPSAGVDEADGQLTPEVVERTLELLQASFDYVILDSGHVLDEVTAVALHRAPPLFLVTTQALPALRNTKRLLELLCSDLGYKREDIHLIVNRYKSRHEKISLRDFEETVQHKAFGLIPNDYYATANAIYQGEPLASVARRAKIAKSFQKLASSLAIEEKRKPSLFARFRNTRGR